MVAEHGHSTKKLCTDKWQYTNTNAPQHKDAHETGMIHEKINLWQTGWWTLVQIPKDAQPDSVQKLCVAGNYYRIDDGRSRVLCACSFSGWSDPFGISFDDKHFKPGDTSISSGIRDVPSFPLSGTISDDGPVVLSPDAKLQMKVEAALPPTALQTVAQEPTPETLG